MSVAEPLDGVYTVEAEGTDDEYWIAPCQNCPGEVMTLIGDQDHTWVHEYTESTDCVEKRRRPSKAELMEFVEGLADDGDQRAIDLLGT
jgi:hypothetical protein